MAMEASSSSSHAAPSASNGQAGNGEANGLVLPPLPTPDQFDFPYPKPYDIQLQLMQTVFRAIEDRKIAIVESPTGTGKSLTLLTSTLTWLAENQKRTDEAGEARLLESLRGDQADEPAWVVEHALKAHLEEARAGQDERRQRLEMAKARERSRKQRESWALGGMRGRKKTKVEYEGPGEERGEEEFLPDDLPDEVQNVGGRGGGGEEMHLSKEVRELMAKYEAGRPSNYLEEEEEEDVPKIYYTSRTHTQLRQLTSELLKTSFGNPPRPPPPSPPPPGVDPPASYYQRPPEVVGVSLVPLGSRKQLCINPTVRRLGESGGDERINEACLDLQKSGSKARCEFLPKKNEDHRMVEARDAVLADVKDIEDIVEMGKSLRCCPYYATRRAVKLAQLVTLPYNLILQKNAREALEIDLKDQIVVIDEAHNLIDTLLSIHSTTLTSSQLSNATSQLQQYLARFRSRLKPAHALWIRQTLSVLGGLVKLCESVIANAKAKGKGKAEMLRANELMSRLGGGADQVNLMELVKYLKESKLARKVSGFSEKTAEDLARQISNGSRHQMSTSLKHASISAFHQVEAFLLSLTDARDDGCILLSYDDDTPKTGVTLKYILLNPAERFREVVEQARCIVLAGGTMEPISDFMRQLFPFICTDRISTLSCKHVIPKQNLLTQVVSVGPRKGEFEFKFANRGDDSLLAELGAVVLSVIGLVPDGVVVFLPSYAFLDKVKAAWQASGVLGKIAEKKQLFYEPQTSGDIEAILRDYAGAITFASLPPSSTASGEKRKVTGALMFAVVGGKLSEGINFSDSLGRCVIMVGLPFANVGSVELQERMKYVESLPGAGPRAASELYENLCMRAVNQSIGRAIRHANDYACILLVDKRFATSRIRNKLPKWIGDDVVVPPDYGGVARGIATFFKDKRDRGLR